MVRQSSVHSHLRGDIEGVREGLDIVGWAVGLLEVGDVEGENEGETLGLRDGEKEGRTLGESEEGAIVGSTDGETEGLLRKKTPQIFEKHPTFVVCSITTNSCYWYYLC